MLTVLGIIVLTSISFGINMSLKEKVDFLKERLETLEKQTKTLERKIIALENNND